MMCTISKFSTTVLESINIDSSPIYIEAENIRPSETPIKDLIDLGFNLDNLFEFKDSYMRRRMSKNLFLLRNTNSVLKVFEGTGLIKKLKDGPRTYYTAWYKDWGLEEPKE